MKKYILLVLLGIVLFLGCTKKPETASECGDGTCAGDETTATCPQDCTASAGMGLIITTFEECAAAGNPVMESYPRQCSTPEGQLFVEEVVIKDIEGYDLTAGEIAKHNSTGDCFIIINNKVYDATDYISSHPGGAAISQGCGTDATELFETRPMGSGKPHSTMARVLLGDYYIGDKV